MKVAEKVSDGVRIMIKMHLQHFAIVKQAIVSWANLPVQKENAQCLILVEVYFSWRKFSYLSIPEK